MTLVVSSARGHARCCQHEETADVMIGSVCFFCLGSTLPVIFLNESLPDLVIIAIPLSAPACLLAAKYSQRVGALNRRHKVPPVFLYPQGVPNNTSRRVGVLKSRKVVASKASSQNVLKITSLRVQ